jgi:hypothetical protein
MKNDPSRRTVLRLVGVSGIWGAAKAGFASTLEDKCQTSSDHIAWVVESLERMLTIKPGMTRNQLMKIFSTEGGSLYRKTALFCEPRLSVLQSRCHISPGSGLA